MAGTEGDELLTNAELEEEELLPEPELEGEENEGDFEEEDGGG